MSFKDEISEAIIDLKRRVKADPTIAERYNQHFQNQKEDDDYLAGKNSIPKDADYNKVYASQKNKGTVFGVIARTMIGNGEEIPRDAIIKALEKAIHGESQ